MAVCSQTENFCVVHCQTFNHAPFILDALRGFVMQQTGFPFTVVVIDDASTDGTPAVLQDFWEKECNPDAATRVENADYLCLEAPHCTNTHCNLAIVLLKCNHYSQHKPVHPYIDLWAGQSRYFASCEGDDYWENPHKLQLQVDFLEQHPEFDACCGRFKHLIQETGQILPFDLYNDLITEDTDGIELVQKHYLMDVLPHLCTIVFRSHTNQDMRPPDYIRHDFDIARIWLYLKQGHRIWLMNVPMSVYRKHASGLTMQAEQRMSRMLYEEYSDLYRFDPCDILRHQALRFWKELVFSQLTRYGMTFSSLLTLYREMLRLKPGFMAWGSATKCVLKALGVKFITRCKAGLESK